MKKIILSIFFFFIFNGTASAVIEVDITRGNLDPLPIAISPLYLQPGSKDIKHGEKVIKNVGERISKLIETNLKRSGLFNPLNQESFVQAPDIAHVKPRFEDSGKFAFFGILIYVHLYGSTLESKRCSCNGCAALDPTDSTKRKV